MLFQDRTYAVLIVSSSEKFCDALRLQLPGTDYWPIDTATNAAAARRTLLNREYDLILVNSPLKDEFGTQFAIDVCTKTSASVLLFVKNELIDEISAEGMEHGLATIAKPTSAALISQSLHLMCAQRERLLRTEEKQRDIEEQITEMRIVNRAKWLLIEQKGMSEAEAHRYVEKLAMDERISKREAARRVIFLFE